MTDADFPADALYRLAIRHEDAVAEIPGSEMLTLRAPVWRPEDHANAAPILRQAIDAYTALADRYLEDTTALKARVGYLLAKLNGAPDAP